MNIKKGDLVMVVRGRRCGCPSPSDGVSGVVESLENDHFFYFDCLHDSYRCETAIFGSHSVETFRLIKIDPPAEGETREAYKELTA